MRIHSINVTGWIVAVLLMLPLAVLAGGPNTVNYQGRLTDIAGAPMADGTYNFTFRIYATDAGGVALWNSGTQSVNVKDGLFTVELGASPMPAFGSTLFADSSRWLGITVGTDTEMIPRMRLTNVPYSVTTGDVYVNEVGDTMTSNLKIDVSAVGLDADLGRDITLFTDGVRTAKLYGTDWGTLELYASTARRLLKLDAYRYSGGEFLLYDSSGARKVYIGAGAGGAIGASMGLRSGGGTTTFAVNADMTGDEAVLVPSDAISSAEILGEPGVASAVNTSWVTLGSGNIDYTIEFVDITAPAGGHIEVTAGAYLNLFHTNGTDTRVVLSIDETSANASYSIAGSTIDNVPSVLPSSAYQTGASVRRVYSVSAGAHRYYLNAEYSSGTNNSTNVYRPTMQAKFFPTQYGTVETMASAAAAGGVDDREATMGLKPGVPVTVNRVTMEEANRRILEAVEAKQAELTARLNALEEENARLRDKLTRETE